MRDLDVTSQSPAWWLSGHCYLWRVSVMFSLSKWDDAQALLTYLQSIGNKIAAVGRRSNTTSAIINYACQKIEIAIRNAFSKMTLVGEGLNAANRGTFPEQELRDGYKAMNEQPLPCLCCPFFGSLWSARGAPGVTLLVRLDLHLRAFLF
jgi:hypothetical protein